MRGADVTAAVSAASAGALWGEHGSFPRGGGRLLGSALADEAARRALLRQGSGRGRPPPRSPEAGGGGDSGSARLSAPRRPGPGPAGNFSSPLPRGAPALPAAGGGAGGAAFPAAPRSPPLPSRDGAPLASPAPAALPGCAPAPPARRPAPFGPEERRRCPAGATPPRRLPSRRAAAAGGGVGGRSAPQPPHPRTCCPGAGERAPGPAAVEQPPPGRARGPRVGPREAVVRGGGAGQGGRQRAPSVVVN